MSEAAVERPSPILPFRWLVIISLGLAFIAFLGGRHLYKRQGGYRPLALMHVPQTMRYRARVEINDPRRAPLLAPVRAALDPRGARQAKLEEQLGKPLREVVREVAFGAGRDASEFVVVVGLQLPVGAGTQLAKKLCEVLTEEGRRSQPTDFGCTLSDGSLIAQTPEGALLLSSHRDLVKDLLGRPELGDRMGFSGPSVRGVAPEVEELKKESTALATALEPKYR